MLQEVRCPALTTSVTLGVVTTTPATDRERTGNRGIPERAAPEEAHAVPRTEPEPTTERVATVLTRQGAVETV
ncbi:hypothetical protein GCM10027444_28950 [Actinopolyspora lacussalsi]